MTKFVGAIFLVVLLLPASHAQSGGPFQITQTVVAGGGTDSTGVNFAIVGTAGQHTTTESNATGFSLQSGFWSATLVPTAAGVSISGQIRTAYGTGVPNVRVTLTHLATGQTISALSSTFGYYRFDDVTVGQLYMLSVEAKRLVFEPNSRVFSLVDEIRDEDFVANPK